MFIGEVFDEALVKAELPDFSSLAGVLLAPENHDSILTPGVAHGFQVKKTVSYFILLRKLLQDTNLGLAFRTTRSHKMA